MKKLILVVLFAALAFTAVVVVNAWEPVPPDGRVYNPDGEAPWGYTPTCQPKEPVLPLPPMLP